jgi:hypothetical protein
MGSSSHTCSGWHLSFLACIQICRSWSISVFFPQHATICCDWSRAFRIVTGKASQTDLQRLVPHACMSHVMKDARRNGNWGKQRRSPYCVDISIVSTFSHSGKKDHRAHSFWIFCFSLMANSVTLTQLEHVLKHMSVVLYSKFVSPVVQKSYMYDYLP